MRFYYELLTQKPFHENDVFWHLYSHFAPTKGRKLSNQKWYFDAPYQIYDVIVKIAVVTPFLV